MNIASPILGFTQRKMPSHGTATAAPSNGDHCTASAANAADALVMTTAGARERRVAAQTNAALTSAANRLAATDRGSAASGEIASAAVNG